MKTEMEVYYMGPAHADPRTLTISPHLRLGRVSVTRICRLRGSAGGGNDFGALAGMLPNTNGIKVK